MHCCLLNSHDAYVEIRKGQEAMANKIKPYVKRLEDKLRINNI